MISTSEVNKDPISSGVFKRIAQRTGGKAYWAKTWQKQVEAFENIREDLGNSYTVTYYPKTQPERGLPQDHDRGYQRPGQEVANYFAARLQAQQVAVVVPAADRPRRRWVKR